MFRYEMRSARMQTPGEETAHNEVDEWFPPERTDKQVVENEDAEKVHPVPGSWTLGTYESWSKSVEKQLKRAISVLSLFLIKGLGKYHDVRKERLAGHIVEYNRFQSTGKIRIDAIFAQKLVVLDMIALEGHGIRNANGQVGDDGEAFVRSDGSKSEVMRDLVDREKGVLVEGTAYNVGCDGEERGEGVSMTE